MARKETEKQKKGKAIADKLGITWDSPGKVFKQIEKKGYKWNTELKQWIKPGKTLKISIEWNDDGYLEDLTESVIDFLQTHEDYTFELASPKYQTYTPSEWENGNKVRDKEGFEAVTLYFNDLDGDEIVPTDSLEDSDE